MSKKFYKKNTSSFSPKKRNTILMFLLVVCFAIYILNNIMEGSLYDYISENQFIQTIFHFGTLYTFLSFFYNLSFIKQIDKKDIVELYEQKK